VTIARCATGGAETRGEERVHPRREREAEIRLGKAEVAAVAAHHGEVEAECEHRARRKRVPVDGRDGGRVESQYPTEERFDTGERCGGPRWIRAHVLEVQAVGEELPGSG
jgi:hypothetical protein